MGSTKPQLFAISNEETPAPDSGSDDPPSGEHRTGEHEHARPEEDGVEEVEGRPVTNAEYRDGRPRWEIAKLSEGEWRRALAHNDREIAEVAPGSPEFARLMEARHRLAFPPPAGIKYDDISKYHAEQVRRELRERMKAPPRSKLDKRWLLLGLGFVALVVAAAVFLLPEIGGGAGRPSDAAATVAPTATTIAPTVTPSTASPTAPAVPASAAESDTAESGTPESAAPPQTQAPTAVPPPPRTAGQPAKGTSAPPPTSAPVAPTATSDQSLPYFLPKQKSK